MANQELTVAQNIRLPLSPRANIIQHAVFMKLNGSEFHEALNVNMRFVAKFLHSHLNSLKIELSQVDTFYNSAFIF